MQATLAATTRGTRGKNEARRLRAAGRLPAVIYGGTSKESAAVAVEPKPLLQILHSEAGVNTLIDLTVEGGETSRVLIKDLQVDPISSHLLHVDFLRLAMDQTIQVTVPIVLVGEAVGVKLQGGMLDFVTREIEVVCLPAEIPEHIEVDVSGLDINDAVRVRDVVGQATWETVSDLDMLLVHVTPPKVEETAAEDEAAAAAGTEPPVEKAGDEGGS